MKRNAVMDRLLRTTGFRITTTSFIKYTERERTQEVQSSPARYSSRTAHVDHKTHNDRHNSTVYFRV